MEVVSRIKGYPILRTDMIRREVLKNEDIFDEEVASSMDKRKLVYDEMFKRAGEIVSSGVGVILDASEIVLVQARFLGGPVEDGAYLFAPRRPDAQRAGVNELLEKHQPVALDDQVVAQLEQIEESWWREVESTTKT